MRILKAAAAALLIFSSLTPTAQAKDVDDATYFVMLNVISRMRIMSENCRLQFDSKYDADFLTALASTNVDVGKATQDLIEYYKTEKHRSGSECAADSSARLETLDNIYKMTLESISKS
jgi:hypothetical protein